MKPTLLRLARKKEKVFFLETQRPNSRSVSIKPGTTTFFIQVGQVLRADRMGYTTVKTDIKMKP